MKLITLLFCLIAQLAKSQSPFLAAGVESTAMSDMFLFAGNPFAGINNLSTQKIDKAFIGISLQKPYFLSDLLQLDGIFAKPYKHHQGALYVRSLKAPYYACNALGLGIGFKMHPKIQTAIQTELQTEHVSGYGTSLGNRWKLAFTTSPFAKCQFAWLIAINLPHKFKASLDITHVFALQYCINHQAKLISEIQWQDKQTPVLKTGFCYQVDKYWQLLSGFTFSNAQFATGLTYKKKLISYGFAIRYHQVLGTGHAIQICYDL